MGCFFAWEYGFPPTEPPVIYYDNIGATYLCANHVFHSRMKHVAMDYQIIRDLVQSGYLRVTHVYSADQFVVTLTKPLSRAKFMPMCQYWTLLPRSILKERIEIVKICQRYTVVPIIFFVI